MSLEIQIILKYFIIFSQWFFPDLRVGEINFIYNQLNLNSEMVKRTSTMQATLKDAKKMVKKQKKPRTSTINETLATANQGLKPKKKATKTRTMVATLKEAQAASPAKKQAKKATKTKKVAKKSPA